jgi:hypothetical protein
VGRSEGGKLRSHYPSRGRGGTPHDRLHGRPDPYIYIVCE